MKSSSIPSPLSVPISNETANIIDLLRVIGMKELTNNIFSLPKKKKLIDEFKN